MSKEVKVPRRIAAVILNSLKGGVVPRIGLPYITVGREVEIQALLHDLDLIADKLAVCRKTLTLASLQTTLRRQIGIGNNKILTHRMSSNGLN